jgi:hypothetical protein
MMGYGVIMFYFVTKMGYDEMFLFFDSVYTNQKYFTFFKEVNALYETCVEMIQECQMNGL